MQTVLILGPLGAALVNRFGFRIVGITGSIIAIISTLGASWSQSFEAVVVIYGVIGGIGNGMVYICGIIAVNTLGLYFYWAF